ncbi:type II toxin-antitoxin system RelE family toxin [Novosphingobium huizhouense]|uniref:type II toxin-antitoxin system RelE family toxin n=1 Tax=Novosphingobium huizhouense TaxID=2866625 RepID=UPI001CD89F18|nr:type II toxin-antitoxin system RelE/ParE family toxin [Novosphingobium huizhouense]
MTYSIEIASEALKEWAKLDASVKRQAVRKLETLLENPRVPSAALRDMPDCYKIKLRSAGFRIIYKVIEQRLVILIVAAGKRDSTTADIYATARRRVRDRSG